MSKSLFLLALLCAPCVAIAAAEFPDFSAWKEVVGQHIAPGVMEDIPVNIVNYTAISKDTNFQAALATIAKADVSGFNRNQTYAFFMNVYNILAVDMIIQHPCKSSIFGSCSPIKSIKDIGSILHPVWNMNAGVVAGQNRSLQSVEDFLRKPDPFKEDPRLHACIVCASISCPNVRNEPYVPESIDEQMTDQMRSFLSNQKKGMQLDRASKTLTLSPIFQWFEGDFTAAAGSVKAFVSGFVSEDDAAFLKANDVTVEHFTYDWNVNGDPPCHC